MTNPFTPEIVGWAQAAQAKWQIPASLILSAAMLESSLGKATPPKSNNWFGIKSAHGVKVSTGEQTKSGVHYTIVAGFMMFKTPADGFMYYGELLGTFAPYHAMVTKFLFSRRAPLDVIALSHALTGVYASALNYGTSLVNIQQDYNLYQYDKPQETPMPTPTASSPAPASTAAAASPPAVPAQNTTQLTLAYGSAAKDALIMLDQGVDLVFASIYAKYVPALVQAFVPSSTLTNVIDAEFANLEADVADKALTFDTHAMIVKNVLLALMTAFPALGAALGTLPTALVAELKMLGVLKA